MNPAAQAKSSGVGNDIPVFSAIHFDIRRDQKVEPAPISIWCVVVHCRDARVHDDLSACQAWAERCVQLAPLKGHPAPSCPCDSVGLGMHRSSARLLRVAVRVVLPHLEQGSTHEAVATVVAVRHPCRRTVVARADDATPLGDDHTHMRSVASAAGSEDHRRVHQDLDLRRSSHVAQPLIFIMGRSPAKTCSEPMHIVRFPIDMPS
jgi:hypothetical protein